MRVCKEHKDAYTDMLQYMKALGYWKREKPANVVISNFLCVDSIDDVDLTYAMLKWHKDFKQKLRQLDA